MGEATAAIPEATSGPQAPLRVLWCRLAQFDPDVIVEARCEGEWCLGVAPGVATDPESTHASGLLLEQVILGGCKLGHLFREHGDGIVRLSSEADIELVISMCLEGVAQLGNPGGDSCGGSGTDVVRGDESRATADIVVANATPTAPAGAQVSTLTPISCAASKAPTSEPSFESVAESDELAACSDGSALERLQLLSRLLLGMDSGAAMNVSAVGERAYELHSVTVNGRTLQSGFGTITEKTNVRRIFDVCRLATIDTGEGTPVSSRTSAAS